MYSSADREPQREQDLAEALGLLLGVAADLDDVAGRDLPRAADLRVDRLLDRLGDLVEHVALRHVRGDVTVRARL